MAYYCFPRSLEGLKLRRCLCRSAALQDNFYEKSDGLVGVCRDQDSASSKTFTFDLGSFEPPQDV